VTVYVRFKPDSFCETCIFYTRLIQFRVAGGLEPKLPFGDRQAYTLDSSPVHHRSFGSTKKLHMQDFCIAKDFEIPMRLKFPPQQTFSL